MIAFILGCILGGIIAIGLVAMLGGDSYEDGYYQAMKDMDRRPNDRETHTG